MEAYWAYADFEDMMALTEELVAHVAVAVTGSTRVPFGAVILDFTPPWPRTPMAELVKQQTGVDFFGHG